MFLRIHMNLQGHILKVKATLLLANPDEAAAVKQVRLNQADKTKLTRDHSSTQSVHQFQDFYPVQVAWNNRNQGFEGRDHSHPTAS